MEAERVPARGGGVRPCCVPVDGGPLDTPCMAGDDWLGTRGEVWWAEVGPFPSTEGSMGACTRAFA